MSELFDVPGVHLALYDLRRANKFEARLLQIVPLLVYYRCQLMK